MDWIEQARIVFAADRPAHFTNFEHCCECAEHDATLLASTIDAIGLQELGNPGWDPICFCTVEGKKYFMPALVRLSLDTVEDEFYLAQLLFHLEYDGPRNRLYLSCSAEQRQFIALFVEHMINTWPGQIEEAYCTDSALAVCQIWTA